MKRVLLTTPELGGFLLGMLDVLPRAIAAFTWAPSKASLHGLLLLGNVHHVNGPRAFGLGTFDWFGIGAAVLGMLYAGVRFGGAALRIENSAFLLSRALFGAIAGVLALNVAEAAVTGKVTNWFGLAYGSRFTAINGGDVLAMICVAALPLATAAAFLLPLMARPRLP